MGQEEVKKINRKYRQALVIGVLSMMGVIIFGPVMNKTAPALICLAIVFANSVYYLFFE